MGNDLKPRYAACEVRKEQYVKLWDTDLKTAVFKHPLFCCYALWCSPCASFQLRKQAIHNDMTRYLCCGGYLPCSGRCGEQRCPTFCLVSEVCCCFSQSVASTRWMIQDEMHLQNTKCDNCIITTTVVLQYLSCIFSCIAMCVDQPAVSQAAYILDFIADVLWVSMCACMQTQHSVQLKARDANPALIQPLNPYMAPVQQAMGIPVYAPPPPGSQQYGAPPPGSYPPPPQGYPAPPQGYPAQQGAPPAYYYPPPAK